MKLQSDKPSLILSCETLLEPGLIVTTLLALLNL